MKIYAVVLTTLTAIFAGPISADEQTAAEFIKQAHRYDNMYSLGPHTSQQEALKLYQSALEAGPDDEQRLHILYRTAQLYGCAYQVKKGEKPDFDKAIALYEQIIESYPPDEPLVFKCMITIGDHYVGKRQFLIALDWFKKPLEYDTSKMEQQVEAGEQIFQTIMHARRESGPDPGDSRRWREQIEQIERGHSLKPILDEIKRSQLIAVDQVAYAASRESSFLVEAELRAIVENHAGSFIGRRADELLAEIIETNSESLISVFDDLPYLPSERALERAGPAPTGVTQVEIGPPVASDSIRQQAGVASSPEPNSVERPQEDKYTARQTRAPPPYISIAVIAAAGLAILGFAAVMTKKRKNVKLGKEINR
ncbi:MAG: tetratricopeptide repeat protein [Planctomycetota bacterium]|jgi:tetratricopeptide (TPR) repeat protein